MDIWPSVRQNDAIWKPNQVKNKYLFPFDYIKIDEKAVTFLR